MATTTVRVVLTIDVDDALRLVDFAKNARSAEGLPARKFTSVEERLRDAVQTWVGAVVWQEDYAEGCTEAGLSVRTTVLPA